MHYFDYESKAREANIPDAMLTAWRDGFAEEYPDDEMMIELRLLRACSAVADGHESLDAVSRALEQEFAENVDSAPLK